MTVYPEKKIMRALPSPDNWIYTCDKNVSSCYLLDTYLLYLLVEWFGATLNNSSVLVKLFKGSVAFGGA